jgi:hypothetical protein
MAYKIIDNFLPPFSFQQILESYTDMKVPWYFRDYVSTRGEGEIAEPQNYQFINISYDRGLAYGSGLTFVQDILNELRALTVIRIKANLLPVRDRIIQFPMHHDNPAFTDNDLQYSVGIYYLNTNNGYTVLEDGTKIESIANRMVLLPGNMLHTGTTSTDTKRLLINFNFISADTPSLY